MTSYSRRTEEARRARRVEVCYRCEISGPGLVAVPGLIVNISPIGCMIRCTAEVMPDTTVSFVLPVLGTWRGRIAWAIGARIGIAFDETIAETPFEVMLGHMSGPDSAMDIF